jgi:hypothetical protein
MLSSHACTTVYLNLGHVLFGYRGRGADRLQVGRRQRGGPLQRSTSRERREGAVEGASDLFEPENSSPGAVPTLQEQLELTPETHFCLSELYRLRANRGSGVHEHLNCDGWCHRDTPGSSRRHSDCHTRWSAGARSAGQRWPIHHLTGRSRNAFDSDIGAGLVRRHVVHLAASHFPRAPTLAAVPDSARQATLTVSVRGPSRAHRAASRSAGRRCGC